MNSRKFTGRFSVVVLSLVLLALSQIVMAADNISYDEYLIKSLNDENIGRRASAAQLLGDRSVQLAVQPLINMLQSDKDFRVRIVAAVSIYKVGDSSVLSQLKKIYKNEKNRTVRHVLSGIIVAFQTQEQKSITL